MIEEWFFSFCNGFVLIALALLIRVQTGSWLHPGAFFTLSWGFFVFLSIFFIGYKLWWGVTLWIFFVCIAVSAGSMIGSLSSLWQKKDVPYCLDIRFLKLREFVLLCSLFSFIGVVILMDLSESGFSLSNPLESFIRLGREYSIKRYTDENYREPTLAIFFMSISYFAALLGGTLYACDNSSKISRRIALFSILPSILFASIMTTRASFLFAGILWISAFLSTLYLTKKSLIFNLKTIFIILLLCGIAIVLFIGLQVSRMGIAPGDFDLSIINYGWNHARISYFGSILAFSQWFEQHWNEEISPTFGSYTFGRVLQWIGVISFKTHDPVVIKQGLPDTTVFTLLRDVAEDFTLPGSLVLFFILGLVAGIAYKKIYYGRVSYFPILILFYATSMASISTFIFRYTTTTFALILYTGYVIFLGRVRIFRYNLRNCL